MNCLGDVSNALACGLAGEVVRRFGEVRLRVFGTSMVPSILPGDLISVRRADLHEISIGEVVLYRHPAGLAAHRVVAKADVSNEAFLITRGDRLCQNDPPVSASELLGRVTSIERGRRRIHRLTGLSRFEQLIARFLQSSNRATSVYLRLAAGGRNLFAPRVKCRA